MERAICASTWIEENERAFVPPVANKLMYRNQLSVMFVGGPNSRTDFHVDESSEFFFQMRGSMNLLTIQGGQRKVVPIKEGEVYLLPSRIPHSPQRPETGSVGLVIERKREENEFDCMRWFKDFDTCNDVQFEQFFICNDLAVDLVPVANAYKEFVNDGATFNRSADLPILDDLRSQVPAPFSLSAWCEAHTDQFAAGATIALFGNEHPDKEFSVLISSECDFAIRESNYEIFIYQISGEATIVQDNSREEQVLHTSACFVIAPDASYRVTSRVGNSFHTTILEFTLPYKVIAEIFARNGKFKKFQFAPKAGIFKTSSPEEPPHRYHKFAWDCEYVTPQRDAPDRVNKFYRGRFGLLDDIDALELDMDEEMWFSLTPKEVSKSHVEAFAPVTGNGIILDMFSGLGCDLLQLPNGWFGIGCDIMGDRLKTAQAIHKKKGQLRTDFVLTDSMTQRSCFRRSAFDVVYLSPPWGHRNIVNRKQTPVYGRRKLTTLEVDGFRVFIQAMKLAKDMNIAYYLPRGMDVSELRLLAETAGEKDNLFVDIHESFDPDDETVSEKHRYRVRAITVYFGNLVQPKLAEQHI